MGGIAANAKLKLPGDEGFGVPKEEYDRRLKDIKQKAIDKTKIAGLIVRI